VAPAKNIATALQKMPPAAKNIIYLQPYKYYTGSKQIRHRQQTDPTQEAFLPNILQTSTNNLKTTNK